MEASRRAMPIGQQASETVLNVLVHAVRDEFQDHPFLWQANKWISDAGFGSNAQRLPNVPHGLNDYSDYDRIAFLSALNPRSDHFRFLKTRGVDAGRRPTCHLLLSRYQSVMRTSIRDPQSTAPKTVIVPDISAAEYLEGAFPGAQVEKLKTGLIRVGSTNKAWSSTQIQFSQRATAGISPKEEGIRAKNSSSNSKSFPMLERRVVVMKKEDR